MTYFEPSREKLYALAIMPMAENQEAWEEWKALKQDKVTLKRDIAACFEKGSIKGLELIINESDWYFYPVYMLPPEGRWSKGRVFLLGDAAHAVSSVPHSPWLYHLTSTNRCHLRAKVPVSRLKTVSYSHTYLARG
jgi:2-polyprenyl-6-methoxyphenol hydroxylase-like FAD-dependent oxidoreductase